MKKKLEFFVSESLNVYENIAFEYGLLRTCQSDAVRIFLWSNDKTVVIGKNQNALGEVNLPALEKIGGRLARRLSGGGAVYHDKNNLNFTFVAKDCNYDVQKQLSVIARALGKWGIRVEVSGRNDVLAEGRKFSGNAFLHEKGFSLHHGTILIDTDISVMTSVLNVDKDKLASKGVKSVSARVINLSELNSGIQKEALVEEIRAAAEGIYGVKSEAGQFVLDKAARGMEEMLKSKEWLVNRVRDEKDGYTVKRARFDWGGVELIYKSDGDRLEDLFIFSDAMDVEEISRINKRLGDGGLASLEPDSAISRDIIKLFEETDKK